MATVKKKYESDSGTIHVVRIQKETTGDFTNTEPTAAVDSRVKVKVSKTNREYGVRPRFISLTRTISFTAPETRDTIVTASLPILSKTIWDGTTTALEATVKYKGKDFKVSARNEEDY